MAVLVKLIYEEGAGVLTVLATRYTAAAILMMLATRLSGRSLRPPRRTLPWLGMAVFNALAAVSFWNAIKLDEVSRVAPIVYVFPALLALLSALAFRVRLAPWTWGAIALAIAGAALVLGNGLGRPNSLLAAALAFASAVGTALFYLSASRAVGERDWLPAATTLFIVGALAFGPLALATGWQPPNGRGWAILALLVVTGTIAPFSLFFAGMARIGPIHAAILSVSEPAVTVLLALAVLGERFSALQAAGIVLVLASFVVASVGRPQPLEDLPVAPTVLS
jgi:drug/metabolite transporter (DMT)-like permease